MDKLELAKKVLEKELLNPLRKEKTIKTLEILKMFETEKRIEDKYSKHDAVGMKGNLCMCEDIMKNNELSDEVKQEFTMIRKYILDTLNLKK